jgi:hypothetical protein
MSDTMHVICLALVGANNILVSPKHEQERSKYPERVGCLELTA